MFSFMDKSNANHPFANKSFLDLLKNSQCVDEKSGWLPHHFETNDGMLPSYIKFHSYGEYIFDWTWANFYQQNGLTYYPKLIHAIPFTPVNAPKFIGNSNDNEKLINMSFDFYQSHNLSSEHYLFINDEEEKLLNELNFSTLLTHQYHFYNQYNSFDEFLGKLKKNKRKNIKKERKAIQDSDLEIKSYTKNDLSIDLLNDFFLFYLATIDKKGSYVYLTQKFFQGLAEHNVLIKCAFFKEKPIAMALFFYDDQKLYGRNWGILREYEAEFPYLHFELCYYQGINFCIENNLKVFEAGAQGEHKLLRGFEPVIIKSAHHIKIPQCYKIIKNDINFQNEETLKRVDELKSYLPFKIN